jgi:hypothetical protein
MDPLTVAAAIAATKTLVKIVILAAQSAKKIRASCRNEPKMMAPKLQYRPLPLLL